MKSEELAESPVESTATFLFHRRLDTGAKVLCGPKVIQWFSMCPQGRMPDQNARPKECQTNRECQTVWHSLLNYLFENARRSGILWSGILLVWHSGLAFSP